MSYSLYICVDTPDANTDFENQLQQTYTQAIEAFQETETNRFRDSGFDIFVPFDINYQLNDTMVSIDHGIKAVCMKELISHEQPCGYYMYPRSSISKSKYRMANSVGIIDSGYRGNLIAKLDILPVHPETHMIPQYTRLFQICAPDLSTFRTVNLVSKTHPLFNTATERGTGGFGSTNLS